MPYTRTTWVDNTAPYITASNLNNIETGVLDVDRRAIAITPEQYGAVGNDSTDDTTFLQNWLTAITTGSKRGALTPGKTYKITDWLTIGGASTERWSIDLAGATIKQYTTDKGHFRFTRQGTWGFYIGGMGHLTWNTAQTSSNTHAIAIAFDTDGTPGVDGNGYYNFKIDGLRLSNGFRGIAQYADSTTAAVWGADISRIHSNSNMVGSTINFRSTNGAPNLTLRQIYVRADNITEQIVYLSNISAGLVESLEINNSTTSQEIEINNCDGVVLKNIRTEEARNASGVTVNQECNFHGLIETPGSRVTVEGFTIQNKSFVVNAGNGRTWHAAVRANSAASATVLGMVLKGITVTGVTFVGVTADNTSRVSYEQVDRINSTGTKAIDSNITGTTGSIAAFGGRGRLAQAGNYTLLTTDPEYLGITSTAAARTITLPAANTVTPGKTYTVKDESGAAGTNNITIQRAGSDTIDGATTKVINTNYGSAAIYSDGVSKWFAV